MRSTHATFLMVLGVALAATPSTARAIEVEVAPSGAAGTAVHLAQGVVAPVAPSVGADVLLTGERWEGGLHVSVPVLMPFGPADLSVVVRRRWTRGDLTWLLGGAYGMGFVAYRWVTDDASLVPGMTLGVEGGLSYRLLPHVHPFALVRLAVVGVVPAWEPGLSPNLFVGVRFSTSR